MQRQGWRDRVVAGAITAGAVWIAAGTAPVCAETPFGGIDYSGFSAFGTSSGYGASTGVGIPFGPAQKPRREALTPRAVPTPPVNAIPAAAPPLDPVFQGSVLDGPPLLPPGPAPAPPSAAAIVAQAPLPASPDPATTPLTLPGAPPPAAPGYGSPSLGYGPPVSYAPPPTAIPAPPTAVPPEIPPPAAPRQPTTETPSWEGLAPWRNPPDGPERRFYLAGILGADFATLELAGGPNANGPLFTCGGAAGIAFERPNGWFRGEFEGRGRDPVVGNFADPLLGNVQVTGSDGWSTMINGWRDFEITDRFHAYLGGGIGGAGYRTAFSSDASPIGITLAGSTRTTGFAWQAGTGLTWMCHERIGVDLGYRFFAVDGGPAELVVQSPPFSFSDAIGTRYGASELLVTVRVFEPFRRWGD